MLFSIFRICLQCLLIFPLLLFAGNKYSIKSGQWNDASLWSPSGVPDASDDVHIMQGHTVFVSGGQFQSHSVFIRKNALLQLSAGALLKIQDIFHVDGEVNMNQGDIEADQGLQFILGDSSVFIWEPGNNTLSGATLLVNATENFSPASTLIIKRWFDYSVPLAAHISGDFGNVTLNSFASNVIFEWNQDNQFAVHQIKGTLTIGRAWITLDKSGKMDSLFIKRIYLENTNSYLDIHGGNHPSGIKLITDEIYNYGGEINGIYNGNGNISIKVNGNVTNYGNMVLIRNTGIFGCGNGNASMEVGGSFIQYTGDFRGIFNLTTFQAGVTSFRFNHLKLLGGIFLAQYACHTGPGINRFEVNGNLEINFSNQQSKFRISGLTSLAGTLNTSATELIIHGITTINGHQQAEITTSGASGFESLSANGNFEVNGCRVQFNMGNHASSLAFNENLIINNGSLSLSSTNGDLTVAVLKNIIVSGGSITLKENAGNAGLYISGDYLQSNGWFTLYSNNSVPSVNPIQMNIQGNFYQTGGNLSFCNNPNSLQPVSVTLESPEIIFNGNATITREGNVYGNLIMARQGLMSFKRLSNAHLISKIKMFIENGCIFQLTSGNLQLASSLTKTTEMLVIKSGGVLSADESKIISNMIHPYSGIKAENHARIRLMNASGFYNGTETGCLNAAGNMNYALEPLSIVEYCGIENQNITSHLHIDSPLESHKYGILEINFNGSSTKKVLLTDKDVSVRTKLKLTRGELHIYGRTLSIESGNPEAIEADSGFINTQPVNTADAGVILWNNLSTGLHTIPLGISKNDLLPFTFNLKSGAGKSISISTRSVNENNLPYPATSPAITGILRNGIDVSVSDVIDRYYEIKASGIKADVELFYSASENTLTTTVNRLALQSWKNGQWSDSFGYGLLASGGGKVSAKDVTQFGIWIIATPFNQASGPYLSFDAINELNQVRLVWELTPGTALPENFQIQRSFNKSLFKTIKEHKVSSPSLTSFEDTDELTEEGEYEYRIAFNQGNQTVYSEKRKIIFRTNINPSVEIVSLLPNPFRSFFELGFHVYEEGLAELNVINQAGQIVFKESIPATSGLNYYKFYDKGNLRPGLYVITLSFNNSVQTGKLFKTE
jgi:hypothetical protein